MLGYAEIIVQKGRENMTELSKKAAFFAIEGGDGSGKTDQITLLQERWETLFPDHSFVFTKEPGGGPKLSKDLRELALNHPESKDAEPATMLSMMIASRFEHVGKFIRPNLDAGRSVVTDRFEASSYAYQIVGQKADSLRGLYTEHRSVVLDMLGDFPLHILLLDVKPEVAMERLAARKYKQGDQNHFDLRPLEFHEEVRRGLLHHKETLHPSTIVIDGNPSQETVHQSIVSAIRGILEAS